MASLAPTYLTRLPRDLEGLILEKLKIPEITLTAQPPEIAPEDIGKFFPALLIKSGVTIRFTVAIPNSYTDNRLYIPNRGGIGKMKISLQEFRQKVVEGTGSNIKFNNDLVLRVRGSLFIVDSWYYPDPEFRVDISQRAMIIVVDRILEYIEPFLK